MRYISAHILIQSLTLSKNSKYSWIIKASMNLLDYIINEKHLS